MTPSTGRLGHRRRPQMTASAVARANTTASLLTEPPARRLTRRPSAGSQEATMRRSLSRAVSQTRRSDLGMATAEYAVGTVAACGFAGVLYKIVTSTPIATLVTQVIDHALHLLF